MSSWLRQDFQRKNELYRTMTEAIKLKIDKDNRLHCKHGIDTYPKRSHIISFQTVSVTVSVLTLTFISVDRWYAICFPLRYRTTIGRAMASVAFIWIVALISGNFESHLFSARLQLINGLHYPHCQKLYLFFVGCRSSAVSYDLTFSFRYPRVSSPYNAAEAFAIWG